MTIPLTKGLVKPANVLTIYEFAVINLIELFKLSETYKFCNISTAIPLGPLNKEFTEFPSLCPANPRVDPAIVVTTPSEIIRIALFPVSAT